MTDILTPDEVDEIENELKHFWGLTGGQAAGKLSSARVLLRSHRAQAARIEEQRADNNALRKRIQDARPMVGLADD